MLPISYGLQKRNVPFTFAGVFDPEDPGLAAEVAIASRACAQRCAVQRRARVGMIGFRPYDFEVCIFNEGLLLERYGAKTVPLNLIDLKAAIDAVPDSDPRSAASSGRSTRFLRGGLPAGDLARIAKLEMVMLRWAEEYRLDALTIQCWSAIQDHVGLTPCLTNGRSHTDGDPRCLRRGRPGGTVHAPAARAGARKGDPVACRHPDAAPVRSGTGSLPGTAATPRPSSRGRRGSRRPGRTAPSPRISPARLAAAEFPLRGGEVSVTRLVEHHGEFRLLHVAGPHGAPRRQHARFLGMGVRGRPVTGCCAPWWRRASSTM